MSQEKSSPSERSEGDRAKVETCRDYEKGLCTRGKHCKFFHSPDVRIDQKKLEVCKDFQSRKCDRAKCRFLHLTFEEEIEYNDRGVLPDHGGRIKSTGHGRGYSSNIDEELCKDYLNNSCTRGGRCRFRHATEKELYLEKQLMAAVSMAQRPAMINEIDDPYGKRRRTDIANPLVEENERLTEENEKLHRKITDLQKQVIDLRKMNDTLYDQNTVYRNQLRGHRD